MRAGYIADVVYLEIYSVFLQHVKSSKCGRSRSRCSFGCTHDPLATSFCFLVPMTWEKKVSFQIAQRVSPCLLRSGRLIFIAQSPGNVPSIVRIPMTGLSERIVMLWLTPTKTIQDLSLRSGQLRFDLNFTRFEIGARSQWFTMIKSSSILRCAGSETSAGLVWNDIHPFAWKFVDHQSAQVLPIWLHLLAWDWKKKTSNYRLSVETSNS